MNIKDVTTSHEGENRYLRLAIDVGHPSDLGQITETPPDLSVKWNDDNRSEL